MPLKNILLWLAGFLLLAGCGLKGSLYLPEEQKPPASTPPAQETTETTAAGQEN